MKKQKLQAKRTIKKAVSMAVSKGPAGSCGSLHSVTARSPSGGSEKDGGVK
jgi:hypothetical protein